MTTAQNCLHARECPISEAPCPGECVFSDVMRSAHLGILVLDVESRSLLFQNQEAALMHAEAAVPATFEGLASIYVASQPDPPSGDPRTARLGPRTIGFSGYGNGPFRWVFLRDITEKLRLESVAEAMELTNSVGSVFSAVRHEIGNPINSVKMALSVLRRNLDRMSRASVDEYLDRSLAELGRVEELLRSLKSFNMYEDVDLEPLELDAFLTDFLGYVQADFKAKGIELSVDVPDGLGDVRADPRALRQVLLNLLTNAADAVAHRAEPRVAVRVAATGAIVRLAVEDNGCGIPRQALVEVFKPFYTSKPHGTGLGLVIARRMLARMHASIEIESDEGTGTTVRIALPRGDGA